MHSMKVLSDKHEPYNIGWGGFIQHNQVLLPILNIKTELIESPNNRNNYIREIAIIFLHSYY